MELVEKLFGENGRFSNSLSLSWRAAQVQFCPFLRIDQKQSD